MEDLSIRTSDTLTEVSAELQQVLNTCRAITWTWDGAAAEITRQQHAQLLLEIELAVQAFETTVTQVRTWEWQAQVETALALAGG